MGEVSALEANVGSYGEMEELNRKLEMALEENNDGGLSGKVKRLLWHGGSVYDAWFSAASNQVRIISSQPALHSAPHNRSV